MAESILVVDDEQDIIDAVEFNLRQAGYRVLTALDGFSAVQKTRDSKPDLVLLDLMLPDLSGTEVLRLLREDPRTQGIPVIVLTARNDEVDRVVGFELGADDYVTKPFSLRELILRVRAILRRGMTKDTNGRDGLKGSAREEVDVLGPIEMNHAQHTVKVDGRPIELTLTEFRLLSELVRAKGRVRTRGVLLSEVWGYDSEVMSRTIDTHVRRLREKLGKASSWLSTVRGVGYRLQDPDRQ